MYSRPHATRRSYTGTALFALALAASAACAQVPPTAVRHYENVLGTSLELKLEAPTAAAQAKAEKAALAEIDRDNAILSAWQPTSEFSRWMKTRNTAKHVSPELLDVLALFDAWREQTHGALDASAETAVRVWKTAEAEHREPTATRTEGRRRRDAAPALEPRPARRHRNPSRRRAHRAEQLRQELYFRSRSRCRSGCGSDRRLAQPGRRHRAPRRADAKRSPSPTRAPTPKTILRSTLIQVGNRTVATSGAYRRGVDINGHHFSHIIDPRTGATAESILSSTVIAPDPSEAGALATAFSVMKPSESQALAARLRNVDYLLVTASGQTIASPHWSRLELPRLQPASFTTQKKKATPAHLDLLITLELASFDNPRFRRPYVAVWVEGEDHNSLKTIALWSQKPRYLEDLRSWYHDTKGATDVSYSVTSATRPPGKYTLRWNGLDDAGKPLPPGKYTVCIEAAREHGTYQIMRQEIDFDGKTPRQFTLPGNTEIAGATLDYGEHEQ